MNNSEKTYWIKSEAKRLGFAFCGIAKAEKLGEDAKRLEQWLNNGMHGTMHYMENYFDERIDPTKLVEGAKSVISLLCNYYTTEKQKEGVPKISKYAYGEDYHLVIRKKLNEFISSIKEKFGNITIRGFVDSAPVLEKAWARKSGVGWVGKNSNLITKEHGSFYFLAELICDIELDYDGPLKDYCGTCTRCIDNCPTEAIVEPYVVDGSKCISYFTIELKEAITDDMKGLFDNWAFGCDICQDVCPWNSFAKQHNEPSFNPSKKLINLSAKEWEEMNDEFFNQHFKNSPIRRTKLKGMKRNVTFIKPSEK
jgi:epoxyqueuosine reductase